MNKQIEEAQYTMNLKLSHNQEVKKDKIIELIGYITKGAKHMTNVQFTDQDSQRSPSGLLTQTLTKDLFQN